MLGLATIFLGLVYTSKSYVVLSFPTNLEQHFRSLEKYHNDYPEADGSAFNAFGADIIDQMTELSTQNASVNDAKSHWVFRAAQCILLGIVLLTGAGISSRWPDVALLFKYLIFKGG